jgi:transposase
MTLDERIYVCKDCGSIIDRDHNSSINILNEGLRQIGTVRTELTPVEIEPSTLMSLRYINSIPYVKASSVYESGSLAVLA